MGPITRRELIARLRALGFEGPFSGGRHLFMKKAQLKVRVPNPHHGGDVGVGLLREILRQAGISPDDWDTAGTK
ncbi:MAG TPA: type II toxin-antitoxin system HicA family toxin [Firmicutes bacterium]|nr:type II toxin-antitoxin system HicA family toxin [Bacillota bacterium]